MIETEEKRRELKRGSKQAQGRAAIFDVPMIYAALQFFRVTQTTHRNHASSALV
jgi:hypothetical protein